ncbi:50S ribosomal protein L33 [Candidatus Berkelbacteria bacterium CG08_land_8_20_14_0_20_39_8]|uniref:Large ribosomal subunit protein bL33 n=1 Tax=Candidatus Berkelbacteria bacterium CG08_land_8_20_14_0_20_39_8 TaxID=1974511 RepID=A0A2M6YCN4_9BACT|nr:MAG: 50S ribosomal protein L33 [Candidatus Berkelbacteria bacterium CG08_land_8_20_14_0_20_39_8]
MAKDAREVITLKCSECKEGNYQTSKNTKLQKERLELNKFCKRCGKHTLHKEAK